MAKALMVQGTGSGVGKSILVTALCRIFLQDGYKVCPFKAQNMALNSYVTKDRGEIGRAQAVQAQACGIEPLVDMNPVLLKPTGAIGAQVIVRGKPIGNMSALEYMKRKKKLFSKVKTSYERLARVNDIMVIEGAGSPAEINLKSHDIVNMRMALYAKAPVILTTDIDKGGAFAWIVGTLQLLNKRERKMVKGIVINKFRGDKELLKSGIDFLERRSGIKVLGVIPYFKDIRLPQEDSVFLETMPEGPASPRQKNGYLNIAVIKLPYISNYTDFDALEKEPKVNLRYVQRPHNLGSPDAIIVPGTKNTIEDLAWLKSSGLAKQILSAIGYPCHGGPRLRPSASPRGGREASRQGRAAILIGICGGYQMLGKKIYDPNGIESQEKSIDGLGILPITTTFAKEKMLSHVRGREISTGLEMRGYEIHHGRTQCPRDSLPVFQITRRQGKEVNNVEGTLSKDGRVLGTYLHGLFDQDRFRNDFLNRLRKRKGLAPIAKVTPFDLEKEYDALAQLVRKNIDIKLLYSILDKKRLRV